MDNWVRVADAQRALGGVIRQEVKQVKGRNQIVSLKEQRRLPQFLQDVAEIMRRSAPPKSRLKADALVDEAMRTAMAKWDKFNPPARGKDGKFLSQQEIHDISAADRGLGTLTFKAYERVVRPDQPPRQLVAAVKRDFEKRSFGTALGTNMGLPGVRDTVHESVLESYDFYYRNVEAQNWGSVKVWETASLWRGTVGWITVVEVSTDGDDGYLELFDADGRPIASGETYCGAFGSWDNAFGDIREKAQYD
jgi:hypothetical protein